jgi:hypothetical protein
LRSIPKTPRTTSRCSARPWREPRKSVSGSPLLGCFDGARFLFAGVFGRFGLGGTLDPGGEHFARGLTLEPRAVLRPERRRLRMDIDVRRRLHARARRSQPCVHDRGRHAALVEQRHGRLADAEARQQRLEVVEVGLRIGADGLAQRVGVLWCERAQRVLDARAELAEHAARHVRRRLRDEEHTDALRANHAHRPLDRLEKCLRRLVEEQVRLVEEEDELRLIEVADLRQLLEQLRHEPHQDGREQPRAVLYRGELEARDDTSAAGCVSQQVADLELRLAEELGAAAVFEFDQRAQEYADRLTGDTADPFQVLLPGVRVEMREQRTQVGQIHERESLLVREAAHQRQARLLGLVRPEHLREQLRAEVGHRGTNRDARPDTAEREDLNRVRGGLVRQPELLHPLRRPSLRRRLLQEAREVALVVGGEDRDAGVRQLLGDQLQGSRLPVPVAPAISPWRFIVRSGSRTTASGWSLSSCKPRPRSTAAPSVAYASAIAALKSVTARTIGMWL